MARLKRRFFLWLHDKLAEAVRERTSHRLANAQALRSRELPFAFANPLQDAIERNLVNQGTGRLKKRFDAADGS